MSLSLDLVWEEGEGREGGGIKREGWREQGGNNPEHNYFRANSKRLVMTAALAKHKPPLSSKEQNCRSDSTHLQKGEF